MQQNTHTTRHSRRILAAVFALAAVGVAVLVVAISTTSYGSNTAGYRAARGQSTPAVHVAHMPGHTARTVKVTKAPAATVTKPTARKVAAKPSSAIPQNNGGDSDADNNGAPSDNDGDI